MAKSKSVSFDSSESSELALGEDGNIKQADGQKSVRNPIHERQKTPFPRGYSQQSHGHREGAEHKTRIPVIPEAKNQLPKIPGGESEQKSSTVTKTLDAKLQLGELPSAETDVKTPKVPGKAEVKQEVSVPALTKKNLVAEGEKKSGNKSQAQSHLQEMCKRFPIFDDKMGLSWFEALEQDFNSSYFSTLSKRLWNEKDGLTPSIEKMWNFTKFFDIKAAKVVILAQDIAMPHENAEGFAFSTTCGTGQDISLSLDNIFTELECESTLQLLLTNNGTVTKSEGGGCGCETKVQFDRPKNHGYLGGWMRQGVLLLSSIVSCEDKTKTAAHEFSNWMIVNILRQIDNKSEDINVVYVLMGTVAQQLYDSVELSKQHYEIRLCHPASQEVGQLGRNFFGKQPFGLCNHYLRKHGTQTINWNDLPPLDKNLNPN